MIRFGGHFDQNTQQGNIPHLLIMDVEFLKLYYSFSILSSSFAPKDTEIHKLYDDLPLDSRFENSKFMLRIDCIIRAIPYMTWIDLQAKTAIVAVYSMISKSSYEKDEFCEPIQIEKAINFITAAINKNIVLFNKETINQDKAQAAQSRRIHIAELQSKIQQVEEWGTSEFNRINAYWNTLQQQEISNINTAIAQAKRDANRKAFSNTLKQALGMAAGYFAGPATCGALGTSAGISTAVTSAAITGATQVAITGGNFRDIIKSATIGGITGGIMSKVPVSGELVGIAKRIEGAKLGILNSAISTGTSTIVLGKGKLDPAAMLGAGLAGASGVNMKGLAKDLTERAIKDTTITAIHGGKLISNLANGAIESSAGHFGKTMGEEFKSNIETERALSRTNPVLEQKSNKEVSEQEKTFKEKGKAKKESLSLESSTNQDKDQILAYQKQRLAAQIINNLNLQRYLQANLQGVNLDVTEMFVLIMHKIDNMDSKELAKLEREFDFYNLQSNELREFKVAKAIFTPEVPSTGDEPSKEPNKSMDATQTFWQRFKENYVKFHSEQDAVEISMNRAQSDTTLRLCERFQERISSVYTNWRDQKDKRLETLQEWYEQEALDLESYVYRQQSEFLMKHTTIAKSRENFDPGNVVNESSISFSLPSTSKIITKAFDIFKLGNEKIHVGLTAFNKQEADINQMELSSSSGLNSSAIISNHFGINVAQVRSKFFNFDLNTLTCNSNLTVNKLLSSSISPSAELSCFAVDAIVTIPKAEILCAFSRCVEIEGSGSWKFGTLRISRDKKEQTKIEGNRGVSTKGQFSMRVVDKSKNTP